jgi:hypothetical protein
MAEQKQTYPRLPISHWWALRKKFRQSLPGVVTDGYIANVLDMKEDSARANVIPFLKTLGIIDDDGKTLELAKKWRDDGQYAEVCKEILSKVYPDELRYAVTEPNQKPQAVRWFLNDTGSGEGAAKMMAALYMVLLEADPSKQPDQDKPDRPKKPERADTKKEETARLRTKTQEARPIPSPSVAPLIPTSPPSTSQRPGININLEIHISADSTPEQIEQIFASMAKHIYKGQ